MPLTHRIILPAFVAIGLGFVSATRVFAADAPDVHQPEAVPPAPVAPGEPLGKPAPVPESPVTNKLLGGRPIKPEAARWTELGLQQIRLRHFKEGIEAFRKATDEDPKHPVVWNNLGSAYLSLGNPLKAKGAFKKAISLDPNYAMAHYNLGAVLDDELDYDGAVVSYARALELDPALGSAEKNPAIVNNSHLAAIHLVLYKRQVGALGTGITATETVTEESGE